jgi:hypothetical protein
MTTLVTTTKLEAGMKVYFEDERFKGNGFIHYIPTQEEQEFQNEVHGESAISVKPRNGKPRFVPISQIVLL